MMSKYIGVIVSKSLKTSIFKHVKGAGATVNLSAVVDATLPIGNCKWWAKTYVCNEAIHKQCFKRLFSKIP